MTEAAHVLLVGNIPEHLEAQTAVLKHFWKVSAASSNAFATILLSAEVVVLCHTLSEAERRNIVKQLNKEAPNLLIVKMNGYDSGPHAGVDAGVDLHHGPGALVSTVYGLLTERGLPSRGWLGAEYEVASGIQ